MPQLSFYTTGEDMTTTIMDLISSGQFYNGIEILREGGADNNMILAFLRGYMHLVGDTRTGMSIEPTHPSVPDKTLFDGWCTFINEYNREHDIEHEIWEFDRVKNIKDNKHLNSLLSIISIDDFIEMFKLDILEASGYRLNKLDDPAPLEEIRDGLILQDGTFVYVGFQEHRYLFPITDQLGLTNTNGDDWGHDEDKCIRISDFEVCGKVITCMGSEFRQEMHPHVKVTNYQIEALNKFKKHFSSVFGSKHSSSMNQVREYINRIEDNGGKWGNLKFLERFYDVYIPQISKIPMDGEYALRSSPKKSMAGILESYFNVTSETHDEYVQKLKDLYEPKKDLRYDNELHWFSQRPVDGINGVCHYLQKGEFEYMASKDRGAVVGGKNESQGISNDAYNYLRDLCRDLYKDLRKQIQLEFVIDENDKVYIVQLRTIKLPNEEKEFDTTGVDIIASGRSFYAGKVEVSLDECLVVQNQVESDEIIGKKCLIVRDWVDFSHALTLSQQLGIVSLYGVGDEVLPEKFCVDTTGRSGVIYHLDKK